MRLLRYETAQICYTKLDPLEDCATWIRGLRSEDYTAEILKQKHHFVNSDRIRKSSQTISAHAESAIDLLEQAFSGPPRVSYLPIYYAMLDLAKIAVICRGWIDQLKNQRVHGANWSGVSVTPQTLLNDHIVLQKHGAIALFYKAIVGSLWSKSGQKVRSGDWISTYKRRIYLRSLYPFIESIDFEYKNIYGKNSYFANIDVRAHETDTGRWRLEVTFPGINNLPLRKKFKILSGLTRAGNRYVTTTVEATSLEDARASLANRFRWYLLYSNATHQEFFTSTPKSSSNFHLPEEIPILLVFFHLGNVVRYDPERLARLFDSKDCGMIEILRRHATYDFLLAIWSYINQCQIGPVGI